jgi:hypothetical protein
MKDQLGHGSNSRGDGGGRQPDAHQAARKEIQLHPNDPSQNAESVLHRIGYSDRDITQLRLNAGMSVASPAHQTGVQVATASKDLTRNMVGPGLDLDRLKKIGGVK